jgi:NADPH-dependent curcumin reductase CurA
MSIRRDHIAAVALLLLGIAVFVLGDDLPFGTPASPGPGMLPKLVAGLMMALAVGLLLMPGAGAPIATLEWDDLPHAAIVVVATAAAAAGYTVLGFPLTIGLLLFGLIWGIERMPLAMSLAISIGMTGATYMLLKSLLKQPMPPGIFGF